MEQQITPQDVVLPAKRQDEPTLEGRMSENAYNNILPARYQCKDEDGNLIEDQEDVFLRVAKNVALADLAHVDGILEVGPSEYRPEFRDEFPDDKDQVAVTEDNVKYLGYDLVLDVLDHDTRRDLELTANEFHDLMRHLAFMPNTPTLINAGDELQQLSACFVDSPADDMDDIHDTAREAAKVFQSGGGMGYAFWKLRPYGDTVGSTGGIASGPITFMRTYDQMCKTIAQGGARRGAQMGVMKISHPDAIEFIHAKNKDVSLAVELGLNDPKDPTNTSFSEALEEARDLMGENGEVPKHLRNAVEGHLSNFNISVGVTQDFMDAVMNDGEFTFTNPRTEEDHIVTRETAELWSRYGYDLEVGEPLTVDANRVWDDIIEGAYENGEPGVVFLDRINEEHSFDVEEHPEHEILATNPCVTGDTLVATADGREAVRIDELAKEGEDVPVYSRAEDGSVVVRNGMNPRKTQQDATVYEVETDGNVTFRCTPDHELYVNWSGYVEAQDLEEGDSLSIMKREYRDTGYVRVGRKGKWPDPEHRVVACSHMDEDIDGKVVHHLDGNGYNNDPENLEVMERNEHQSMHKKVNNPMKDPEVAARSTANTDYDSVGQSVSETRKQKIESGELVVEDVEGQDLPEIRENHKVVSVREVTSEDVYNITVEDTHNFYAGIDVVEGNEQVFLNTHNCGEQPLEEMEACNLAHINLSTLAREDSPDWREYRQGNLEGTEGKWDEDNLERHVRDFLGDAIDWAEFDRRIHTGTHFLDNVVTMSNFPIPEIEEKVTSMRKVGLGIMGYAQLLIQIGVEYGSPVGNEVARQLMTYINHTSKETSHQLAKERGAFEAFTESKYARPSQYPEWFEAHTGQDPDDWAGGFPVRNHNTTTIAPTGTTSMLGNTSSGCEPIYQVAFLKNVSQDIQGDDELVEFDDYFLRVLEANDIDVDQVQNEVRASIEAGEFEGVDSLDSVPAAIGSLFVTTGQLSGREHASVQCAFQDGVDSAISKTVNFPNHATRDDVRDVYEYIYRHGGKGVTVYRDGSRETQVISTSSNKADADEAEDEEPQSEASADAETDTFTPRPVPDKLRGTRYPISTGYGELSIKVFEDNDGRPFEVWAEIGKSGGFTHSFTEAIGRLASVALRAGVPPAEIIDQLDGIRSPKVSWHNGNQIQSVPDAVAFALEEHVEEGGNPTPEPQDEVSENVVTNGGQQETVGSMEALENGENPECPECGALSLSYKEGCKTCEACGWSQCG